MNSIDQFDRVVRRIREDLAKVSVLRLDGDPFKEDQPVYDENCVCPDLNVSVNDVVLFRGWDRDPNLETWSESRPRIYVVYNQEEVGERYIISCIIKEYRDDKWQR